MEEVLYVIARFMSLSVFKIIQMLSKVLLFIYELKVLFLQLSTAKSG
jgi:hypothetical protein